MTDLPPPDLTDNRGRLRRLVIALLVAGAAAMLGYTIADGLAKPDEMIAAGKTAGSVARASQFVFYVAGVVGIVVFLAALKIQNKLADRAYRKSLMPLAQALKDPNE